MKKLVKKDYLFPLTVVVGITLIMFVLNYWTPILYDDYRYHMETKGILTIFADEYHQWLTWTGRSVAHVILRFFLRFPRIVFDLVSAGAFTWLVVAVTKIAQGNGIISRRGRGAMYIFVFALLWVFIPSFSQVFFWKSGAANYELVMVIMLAYLLVYHRAVVNNDIDSHWYKVPLMFVLGTLAGWCNENTSGAVILVVLGYIGIMYFIQHKRLSLWMISGLVGNMIGLFFMISAPGNAIRAAYFPERNNLSVMWKIINGLTELFPSVQNEGAILFTIAFSLLVFLIWQNGIGLNEMISGIYLLAGIASIVVLLVSPTALLWSRSMFGALFFVIISISTSILSLVRHGDSANKLCISVVVAYVGFNFLCGFFTGVSDIYQNHVSFQHQLDSLIKQRDSGKKDLVVPQLTYTAKTKYANPDHNDIGPDKNNIRNKQTAAYWGVRTVRIVPNEK